MFSCLCAICYDILINISRHKCDHSVTAYTAATEKQKTAMKEAGIDYVYQSVYELTYSCLIRLLGEVQ